jgi:Type II CAAX prenyl endopeptidase Rce1-like
MPASLSDRLAGPRPRQVLTGAAALVGLVGMVAARGHPFMVATFAFVLVVAQGRARLRLLGTTAAGQIARRAVRVACYLLPIAIVGPPSLGLTWSAVSVAVLLGAVPLLFEIGNIRTMFSAAYLDLAPISPVDRTKDLILFGLSGAAQEYLYRGLMLAFIAAGRPIAIAVTTVAFVAEHLLQAGGRAHWDRHDIAVLGYLGIVLGVVVVATGSVLAAVVGHTVYNLPNVILALRRRTGRDGLGRAAKTAGQGISQ